MSDNITSIYIHRVSVDVTAWDIMNEFDKLEIGCARRVDFAPVDNKPGFGEEINVVAKSATVYFHHYYLTCKTLDIMNKLNQGDIHHIYPKCVRNEYWIIERSTMVIPDTMMNVEQIVEKSRLLEQKVVEQDVVIRQLEKDVATLKDVLSQVLKDVATIKDVLSQVLGGLFGPTVQGDKCEPSIKMLEQEIETLRRKKQDEEEGVYTQMTYDDLNIVGFTPIEDDDTTPPHYKHGDEEQSTISYSSVLDFDMFNIIESSSPSSHSTIRGSVSYEFCGNE